MRYGSGRHGLQYLLLILWLFFPSTDFSQSLHAGFGIGAGISIPGSGRFTDWGRDHTRYYTDRDLTPHEALFAEMVEEVLTGQFSFRGEQAGPEFNAEFFLGGSRVEVGIGASVFSRQHIRGSLLPSRARIQNAGSSVEPVNRTLTSILLSLRYTLFSNAPTSAYVGGGAGVYSLREKGAGSSYSVEEDTFGLQALAGLQSSLGDSRTKLFTEIRLNLMELGEDSIDERPGIAIFTVAAGIRFGM